LANLSGAPPAGKNEAPDPAATGSSAKNPCQAGGLKIDSTNCGPRKPRPLLTVCYDRIADPTEREAARLYRSLSLEIIAWRAKRARTVAAAA